MKGSTDEGKPQRDRVNRPVPSPIQSRQQTRASTPNHHVDVPDAPLANDVDAPYLEDSSWEYYEPWSWRAICTDTGAQWMQSLTGSHDFGCSVRAFKEHLNPKGSLDRQLTLIPNYKEIDQDLAWEYVNGECLRHGQTRASMLIYIYMVVAFYENCWEADLGILDRNDLEVYLQAHFDNRGSMKDPAWFALRNIVFAAGYRSLLASDPAVSFAAAQVKAGSYFNNALSMLTRLILPPSRLMAVRALTLMVRNPEKIHAKTPKLTIYLL